MSSNDIIHQVWPEWQVRDLLGKGSYGFVYSVVREDAIGDQYAAVKVVSIPHDRSELEALRAEHMNDTDMRIYLEDQVSQLSDEIKLMETVKGNTNIVSIEDHHIIAEPEKLQWHILIRMELLTPLVKRMAKEPLSRKETVKLGMDLCMALSVCREKNIVHRDIKPDNIFINDEGDFKLGDFGVARKLEHMTARFTRIGNYDHMAPEMYNNTINNPDIDSAARMDIYSLGIVLYTLLNKGRLPFLRTDGIPDDKERSNALISRMRGKSLPPPVNGTRSLNRIILKACAYRPEERYGDAYEMRKDLLSASVENESLGSTHLRPIITAVAVLIVVLTGTLLYVMRTDDTGSEEKSSKNEVPGTPILGSPALQSDSPEPLQMLEGSEPPALTPETVTPSPATDTPTPPPTDTPVPDTPTPPPTDTPLPDTPTPPPTDTPVPDTPTPSPTPEPDTPTPLPTSAPVIAPSPRILAADFVENDVSYLIGDHFEMSWDPDGNVDYYIITLLRPDGQEEQLKQTRLDKVEIDIDALPVGRYTVRVCAVPQHGTAEEGQWGSARFALPDSQELFDMACTYMEETGTGGSADKAVSCFELSARLGNLEALNSLGIMFAEGNGVEQSYETAREYFQEAADLGNIDALKSLGVIYENGLGVEQSGSRAFEYYKLAADQGDSEAQLRVGLYYALEDSYELAAQYYRLSSEQGNAEAQMSLGILYETGLAGEQSDEKAAEYYQLAADQGNADAQRNLGILLLEGRGVAQSNESALEYFSLAANQGDAVANYNIGVMYSNGLGVDQSYELAFEYYKLSADQGYAEAQIVVGMMYENGYGVEQSFPKAITYYSLAAEQGNKTAQSMLDALRDRII